MGNDFLNAGGGDDTYLYRTGDGNDVIRNATGGDTDRLVMEDIIGEQLTFELTGGNAEITIHSIDFTQVLGVITVEDWFTAPGAKLDFLNCLDHEFTRAEMDGLLLA